MPMKMVPLRARDGSLRAEAMVDNEDFERINEHRWYLHGVYAARAIWNKGRNTTVMMHREVLGTHNTVDHINRNSLDNRKANLRLATHAQNMQNRKPHRHGRSPYRGVIWDSRRGKWEAVAWLNGKRYRKSGFTNEEQAAVAAREIRRQIHKYAVEA